jgi:hypothetical protein
MPTWLGLIVEAYGHLAHNPGFDLIHRLWKDVSVFKIITCTFANKHEFAY